MPEASDGSFYGHDNHFYVFNLTSIIVPEIVLTATYPQVRLALRLSVWVLNLLLV